MQGTIIPVKIGWNDRK